MLWGTNRGKWKGRQSPWVEPRTPLAWAASALPLSHNSRTTTGPHNPLYMYRTIAHLAKWFLKSKKKKKCSEHLEWKKNKKHSAWVLSWWREFSSQPLTEFLPLKQQQQQQQGSLLLTWNWKTFLSYFVDILKVFLFQVGNRESLSIYVKASWEAAEKLDLP